MVVAGIVALGSAGGLASYAVLKANVEPLAPPGLIPTLSEFQTAECGYDEARKAAQDARRRSEEPEKGITATVRRERAKAADAAEYRAAEAEKCEERAREQLDLRAQWYSATHAENIVRVTDYQAYLSLAEILFLGVTIGVAVAAIVHSHYVSEQAQRLTRDIGQAEVRAYPSLSQPAVGIELNSLMVRFEVVNDGNSPAERFNYAIFMRLEAVRLAPEDMEHLRENDPQYPDIPIGADLRIRRGEPTRINHSLGPLTETEQALARSGRLHAFISIAYRFDDVFENRIADIEHFNTLPSYSEERKLSRGLAWHSKLRDA